MFAVSLLMVYQYTSLTRNSAVRIDNDATAQQSNKQYNNAWSSVDKSIKMLAPDIMPSRIGKGVRHMADSPAEPQRRTIVVNPNMTLSSLPFKVISILPSAEDPTTPYELSGGNSPITVIFNRPVIAIGTEDLDHQDVSSFFKLRCNSAVPVDGRYRWVTTSIARFDVNGAWPTDLNCTFTVDPAAKTYDGASLSETPTPVLYTTPQLTMSIYTVTSEKSDQLTNNTWNPFTNALQQNGSSYNGNYPEVPPDGIVYVTLSYDFQLAAVRTSLKAIRVSDGATIRFNFVNCNQSGINTARVFCISFEDQLGVGEEYSLILAEDAKVHPNAGPTSAPLSVGVYGLFPFVFPFRVSYPISENTQLLLLRHGILDIASTDVATLLKESICFTPSLNFTLIIKDITSIQIDALFEAGKNYTIKINPVKTILDGWSLPLLKHSADFQMRDGQAYAAGLSQQPQIFSPSDNITQTYTINQNKMISYASLDCASSPYSVAGYPVTKSNIIAALTSLATGRPTAELGDSLENITLTQVQDNQPKVTSLNAKRLWQSSGVFLESRTSYIDYQCRPYNQNQLIQESDVSVAVLAYGRDNAIVWVTNTTNNANVEGATVYFYGRQNDSIVLKGKAKTSDSGIVSIPKNSLLNAIVVEYGPSNRLFIHQINLEYAYNADEQPKYQLFTDRGIYKPGDVVLLKGYIKHTKAQQMTHTVTVYWQTEDYDQVTMNITLDPVFNSFDTNFTVPINNKPGHTSLLVSSLNPNGDIVSSSSADFIVGDPRLPSGVVTLASNQTFIEYGDSMTLSINVKTTNYLGTVQNGQNVTLQYKWASNFFDDVYKDASGHINVITDQHGEATAVITLSGQTYQYGDRIDVIASYLDPSRSFIQSETFTRFITNGEYQFKFSLAQFTNAPRVVPGSPQGIFVELYHIPTMTTVNGVTVSLMLTQWETAFAKRTVATTVSTDDTHKYFCTFTTNSEYIAPPCHFTIDDLDPHVIVAHAKDPKNNSISNTFEVNYDPEFWAQNPYKLSESLNLYPDRNYYDDAHLPTITYWNPFASGEVLAYWGCDKYTSMMRMTVPYGVNTVSLLSLPKACRQSGLFFSMAVLGKQEGFDIPAGVPVSSNNRNTARGLTGTKNLSIRQPPTINVTIALDNPVVTPGSSTNITIKVTNSAGQPLTGQAEACVFVVDKRVLDLVPHPLDNGDEFRTYTPWSMITGETSRNGIVDNYIIQFKTMLRRLTFNRWLYGSWYDIDQTDEVFFKGHYNWLTESANMLARNHRWAFNDDIAFDSPLAAAAPPMAEMDGGSAFRGMEKGGGGGAPSNGVSVRSNFQTTPLFVAKAPVKNGQAVVTLDLPDDLTTFEIRTIIVTKDIEIATTEASIISRRDVNILPIQPRFARIGDKFECGVSVVAINPISNITVTINIEQPTLMLLSSSNSSTISIQQGTTSNVVFSLEALSKGPAQMTFFLKSSSGANLDAVRVEFDILGRQAPIYLGTSMAITANSSQPPEGIKLPAAEPGTGTLDVVVGVGRYPSVEANSIQIMAAGAGILPSSSDLLSQQAVFGALISYGFNQTLINQANATLRQLDEKLKPYLGPDSINSYPHLTYQDSYYPTLYAIVLNRLMNVTKLQGWTISPSIDMWRQYIDQQLNRRVEDAHQHNYTVDKEGIAYASLGLGYNWEPTSPDLAQYGWKALSANITDNCGLRCQTYFVLSSLYNSAAGSPPPAFVNSVIKNIENNIRVQGRTAYVTYDAYSKSADIEASAYAALAFIEVGHETPLLEKIVNFVATGGIQPNIVYDYIWSISREQRTLLTVILTNYDRVKKSTRPNLTLTVFKDTPSLEIMSATFDTNHATSVSNSVDFSLLGNNEGQIMFKAVGSGEVSAAVGITYVPATLPTSPIYHGFFVQKVIKPLGSNTSVSMSQLNNTFNVGQLVEVIITITTPDDIGNVIIEDGASAGIEPLDNNVYNLGSDNNNNPVPYYLRFWYRPFPTQETYKTEVIFRGNNIRAGCYTVSYKAIATTKGTFTLPPTKVYARDQPEVFGLSAGSVYSIQA
ncbi:hypothetical protein SAMD00019534_047980 [Acytostelium subglobosum LB1]|uniref:hypothetical protein n=1 Tax=Acytostelium subglobosum LB1 TaxID=1410327 RepID=UPI000644CA2E|nr:hypothetical protein SAMD00019534_047980 [Acytostelium subglobosum LB1]GAM21623.1 hypothetical protein SAMD00019534_047980 [Acytostelium subglobosum LB1]|eukprot:XP_012755742.1 hypothetical protein SAMD00019534_047980 [Acytostelium subglobosum LB1]